MQLVEVLDRPTQEVLEGISAVIRAVRCADHRGGGMVPETGLRRSDAAVLRVLSDVGELRTGDIAHKLGVDASVVSRQLSALIADGLVIRNKDSADARASLNALTDLGRERLAGVYATYADRLHAALGDLSERDLLIAADALRRLAAAIAPAQNPA